MSSPATVTVTEHPPGLPHTAATIGKMGELARKGSHSYTIRNLATRITRDVPSKDVRGELGALYRFVRDNVRYRFDPLGLEWVQSPERTLRELAGDCDDMATLLAGLAGALGHPWQFRTVGPSPTAQKHVAVEVFDGDAWLSLDPVLEPKQSTTSARRDLGRFGARAPGHERIWSSKGSMLASPVGPEGRLLWNAGGLAPADLSGSRRRKYVHVQAHRRGWPNLGALGSPVGPREMELWGWVPGFPPLPPVGPGPVRPPLPQPAWAYRSDGSAGPKIPRELAQLGAVRAGPAHYLIPPGALDGRRKYVQVKAHRRGWPGGMGDATEVVELAGPFYDRNLGWGFLKKIGKAIGKVGKAVVKGVKAVVSSPIFKIAGPLVLSVVPGIGPIAAGALAVASTAGKVLKIGGKAVAVGKEIKELAGAKKNLKRIPKKHRAKVLAAIKKKEKQLAKAAKALEKHEAKKKKAAAAAKVAAKKRAQVAKQRKKTVAAANKQIEAAKKRAAAAAKKRVKAKKVDLSKLPSFPNVKKGAKLKLKKKVTPKKAAKPKAKAAKPAVPSWKQPHPALRARYPGHAKQVYDPTDAVFRVYVAGNLSGGMGAFRPTVSFSLGAVVSQSDYMRHAATFAKAAVDAVAAHIRSRGDKRPPGKSVPAVLQFQEFDSKRAGADFAGNALSPDGLWGSNTQAAAAHYLATTPSALPPTLPALRGTVTWQRPVPLARPEAPRPPPAVAPAPPAPALPAPRPVVVAPPAAKPAPVVVAKPAMVVSAPAVAPKPIAGYTEVGQERDNPGLPPVPPPSSAAPATAAVVQRAPSQAITVAPASLPSVSVPGTAVVRGAPSAAPVAVPGVVRAPASSSAPMSPQAPLDVWGPTLVSPPAAPITAAPAQPIAPAPATVTQLPPPAPYPAQPAPPFYPGGPPAVPIEQASDSSDSLVWLALGWLYLRQRERAS